jgi:hypothetical protein
MYIYLHRCIYAPIMTEAFLFKVLILLVGWRTFSKQHLVERKYMSIYIMYVYIYVHIYIYTYLFVYVHICCSTLVRWDAFILMNVICCIIEKLIEGIFLLHVKEQCPLNQKNR